MSTEFEFLVWKWIKTVLGRLLNKKPSAKSVVGWGSPWLPQLAQAIDTTDVHLPELGSKAPLPTTPPTCLRRHRRMKCYLGWMLPLCGLFQIVLEVVMRPLRDELPQAVFLSCDSVCNNTSESGNMSSLV